LGVTIGRSSLAAQAVRSIAAEIPASRFANLPSPAPLLTLRENKAYSKIYINLQNFGNRVYPTSVIPNNLVGLLNNVKAYLLLA